jgi:hypothetical protein
MDKVEYKKIRQKLEQSLAHLDYEQILHDALQLNKYHTIHWEQKGWVIVSL